MPKQKIEIYNLWMLRSELKLPRKDFSLLVEAFRRKHFLDGVGPTSGWVGMGTAATYRSKYFKPLDGIVPQPRINAWWKLTEEGEKVMKAFEDRLAIPKNRLEKSKVNEFLFTAQF